MSATSSVTGLVVRDSVSVIDGVSVVKMTLTCVLDSRYGARSCGWIPSCASAQSVISV